MRLTLYQRRPAGANFSIERLFVDVRRALPADFEVRVVLPRFPSYGVWRRTYSIIEAVFRQGDVNHITGDVHFLALGLRRKKTLLTIHDLVTVHRLRGIRKLLFVFFWYWLPIKRSALVTVISDATKEDLLRHVHVPPDKLRVVHNCVSSAFHPVPKVFNPVKPVILQVGTGSNKNLERLIIALDGVSCHLRIIGRLSADQLKALASAEVAFSSVSDISDEGVVVEYQRCDMLVFASTFEGFGLPIIEAQATGRPVVTSNLLSMPEVAGDSACLVNPFDAASIRAGVVKVIHDDAYRDGLVMRGLENVKRFHSDYIASKYADIYRELVVSGNRER